MVRRIFLVSAAALAACTSGYAQVVGSVTLKGEAPEIVEIQMTPECAGLHTDPVFEETIVVGDGGGLKNVIVSIKSEEGVELVGEVPAKAAVLDQSGCHYIPHVLPVMVGQEIQIKNSDPFLHNVHALANENPSFNFGQPNVDPGKKIDPMKVAETFKVKCDVHPWMGAFFRVIDHPYFATTGEDGKFSIEGVPDGTYTFVAWHENFGESEQADVEVTGGKAELSFEFDAASASASPVEVRVLADASQAPRSGDKKAAACCPTPAPKSPTTAPSAMIVETGPQARVN